MILNWLNWVRDLLAPYTDFIATFGVVLTAIIAIIALRSTAKDSRERSRPLVLAMFRLAEHSDHSFEFVVRNFGQSGAKDLRIEFDPPLTTEMRTEQAVDHIAMRYERAIPLLPPTAELSNTWWSGKDRGGVELVNRLGTPDEVVVSVSYRGSRWRRYRDSFTLHADTIKFTTSQVSSTSIPGRVSAISTSLSALVKVVQSLDASVKQLKPKD